MFVMVFSAVLLIFVAFSRLFIYSFCSCCGGLCFVEVFLRFLMVFWGVVMFF